MICNILHARYIGPYVALHGETALIRSPVPIGWTIPVHVLAQFDDLSLGMNATHGWVTIPMSHFEVLPAYTVGTPEYERWIAWLDDWSSREENEGASGTDLARAGRTLAAIVSVSVDDAQRQTAA